MMMNEKINFNMELAAEAERILSDFSISISKMDDVIHVRDTLFKLAYTLRDNPELKAHIHTLKFLEIIAAALFHKMYRSLNRKNRVPYGALLLFQYFCSYVYANCEKNNFIKFPDYIAELTEITNPVLPNLDNDKLRISLGEKGQCVEQFISATNLTALQTEFNEIKKEITLDEKRSICCYLKMHLTIECLSEILGDSVTEYIYPVTKVFKVKCLLLDELFAYRTCDEHDGFFAEAEKILLDGDNISEIVKKIKAEPYDLSKLKAQFGDIECM